MRPMRTRFSDQEQQRAGRGLKNRLKVWLEGGGWPSVRLGLCPDERVVAQGISQVCRLRSSLALTQSHSQGGGSGLGRGSPTLAGSSRTWSHGEAGLGVLVVQWVRTAKRRSIRGPLLRAPPPTRIHPLFAPPPSRAWPGCAPSRAAAHAAPPSAPRGSPC